MLKSVYGKAAAPLMLLVIMAAMMTPVFIAESREAWDQGYYISFVENWAALGSPSLTSTHIGYQALVLWLHQTIALAIISAAIGVNVGAYMLSAIITYAVLVGRLSPNYPQRRWIAAGLALALSMVAPLFFVSLPEQNLYFGYITPHVYHNPTSILLKPFALAQTLLVINGLTEAKGTRWRLPLLFLVSVAAIVTKPSFALCLLLPALFLMLWQIYHRQQTDWLSIACGFFVPTLIILGLQSDLLGSTRSGISFAPLESFILNERYLATRFLALKLILSFVFPLLVLIARWREALKSSEMWLAWSTFIIGLAQMLLLNEAEHPGAGNFWWGAQISLFALFVISTRFLLEQLGGYIPRFFPSPSPLLSMTSAAFVLHMVAGIIWYAVHALAYFSHPVQWRMWW